MAGFHHDENKMTMLFVFLRVWSDFDGFFSSLKPEARGATSFYMRGNIDDDDDNEDPCMDEGMGGT